MIPMASRGTQSFRRERLNHADSGGRMKEYDRYTVTFELPVDRTVAEVLEVLDGIGARDVRFYPPRPSSSRPLGRME